MNLSKYCFFLLIVVTISQTNAQRISRVNYGVDIGTGFSSSAWTPSVTYYQNLRFDRAPWLGIGWTGHFTSLLANNPPGLKTLGNPVSEDLLEMGKIRTVSAAFGISLSVYLDPKVEIGGNLDLLNIAFGNTKKGLYKITDLASATDSMETYHNTLIGTYPQILSTAPLIWKRNNGQSQVYLRFWFNPEIGVKIGYMLTNVSFATEEKLNHGQRRFYTDYRMPFVALSFHIPN